MTPDERESLVYLDADDALAVVDLMGFNLRDLGLFLSALSRPQMSAFGADAYPDLATKASAMFQSLVGNPALLDGNKRIAVVLTWTFLLNNGIRLEHTENEAYDFVVAAASSDLDFDDITEWFRTHARPADGT